MASPSYSVSKAKEGFPSGSAVKNLLAIQETWFRSRSWEDPLEEDRATQSSILSGEILWMEESGGLYTCLVTKSRTRLSDWTHAKPKRGQSF